MNFQGTPKFQVLFELLRSISAWDALRLTGAMILKTTGFSYDGITWLRTSKTCDATDDLIITTVLFGKLCEIASTMTDLSATLFSEREVIFAFEATSPKRERLAPASPSNSERQKGSH